MSEYRAGQRVRIEWPDGSAVEGAVRSPNMVEYRRRHYCDLDVATGQDGATVTVLSEPRPEEPTGLGAVVEAGFKDYPGQRWVSVDGSRCRWVSVPYWGFIDWDLLVDPVVLHEGWVEP